MQSCDVTAVRRAKTSGLATTVSLCADEQMLGEVRWIWSYVLDEDRGKADSLRLSSDQSETIQRHGLLASLPLHEIIAVAGTLIARQELEKHCWPAAP